MNIIAVGELLWDCYPNNRQLGGAAVNFVYHVIQTGIHACLISSVGYDIDGDDLLIKLSEKGINYYIQRHNKFPTGKAEVILNKFNIPEYNINYPAAWDLICSNVKLLSIIRTTDVLYFGTLVQRQVLNQHLIRTLVNLLPKTSKIVIDINLRYKNYTPAVVAFCLHNANFLKLNDEELPIIANMLNLPKNTDDFYHHLCRTGHLEMLMYTRGEQGSLLIRGNERDDLPGQEIVTIDTVGAGDAFTAIATILALKNISLKEINLIASKVAAWVCTYQGAIPMMPLNTRYQLGIDIIKKYIL